MAAADHILIDASASLEGVGMVGRFDSCALPDVGFETFEYTAAAGNFDINTRLTKMDATLKAKGMAPDLIGYVGQVTSKEGLVLRGSLKMGTGPEQPAKATLRGSIKTFTGQDFTAGGEFTTELPMSVTYYKLEINGKVVFEIDLLRYICVIGGKDLMAARRKNLGIEGGSTTGNLLGTLSSGNTGDLVNNLSNFIP